MTEFRPIELNELVISRRAMLLGLIGAGSAGAVIGDIAARYSDAAQEEAVSGKTFLEGETIPLPGKPQLDGWRLVFASEQASQYQGPEFTYHLAEGPQSDQNFTLGNGYGGNVESYREDDKEYYAFELKPDTFGAPLPVIYWYGGYGEQAKSRGSVFYVSPKVFGDTAPQYGTKRVYSEVPLDKRLTTQLVEMVTDFAALSGAEVPVFMARTLKPGDRGGEYDPESNTAFIIADALTDPEYLNEGIAKVFHEQSHGLLQHLVIDVQEDQRLNDTMFRAYQRLAEAAGLTVPVPVSGLLGPSSAVENNPCFALFDESHYVPKLKGKEAIYFYGHPYSNYNELFASGMAVLRYFRPEFMKRLRALSTERQQAAIGVVQAIVRVLESANATPAAIEKVQPDLASLKQLS